jgi:hypothetical protein
VPGIQESGGTGQAEDQLTMRHRDGNVPVAFVESANRLRWRTHHNQPPTRPPSGFHLQQHAPRSTTAPLSWTPPRPWRICPGPQSPMLGVSLQVALDTGQDLIQYQNYRLFDT